MEVERWLNTSVPTTGSMESISTAGGHVVQGRPTLFEINSLFSTLKDMYLGRMKWCNGPYSVALLILL